MNDQLFPAYSFSHSPSQFRIRKGYKSFCLSSQRVSASCEKCPGRDIVKPKRPIVVHPSKNKFDTCQHSRGVTVTVSGFWHPIIAGGEGKFEADGLMSLERQLGSWCWKQSKKLDDHNIIWSPDDPDLDFCYLQWKLANIYIYIYNYIHILHIDTYHTPLVQVGSVESAYKGHARSRGEGMKTGKLQIDYCTI